MCVAIEPKLDIMANMLGSAAECWRSPFLLEDGLAAVERIQSRLPEASRMAISISQRQGDSALQAADELVQFIGSEVPPRGQ